jgi:alpha-1,6-mannosyltransferase
VSFLPKLLLNPLITFLLIPLALFYPSTRRSAASLVVPSLAFVAIYSLQPHKEARFIIYVVPPLTTCAALSASYIFARRSRTILNRLLSLLLLISVIGSFAASLVFLAVSSLNYPGGEALFRLHQLVARDRPTADRVSVHMDVLACMTGVSRFQQASPSPPLARRLSALLPPFQPTTDTDPHAAKNAPSSSSGIVYDYDKTESPAALLDPAFWSRFDYVLAEHPETVVGSWEVVDTVFAYGGMEILRPGQQSRSGVGEEVRIWEDLGGKGQDGNGHGSAEIEKEKKERNAEETGSAIAAKKRVWGEVENLGVYGMLREWIRRRVTRGWWVGPRMEAKIRILKRAK